jgi:COP9 signalosome complex subunit 4
LRLYLEDDETVKAEPYLNRAALLVYPETIPDLQIPFKFCQARILDATKKFLLAGWKFLDLACTPQIAEVDRLNCYKQAIKCAILAEAGPARSRLLAALYKDPRYKDLDPEIMHTVLEYVYVGRILPNTMKLEFAEHLDPNHLAILADGSTLLDRAVMEHNIKSISSLYTSIRFDQLANILGSDEDTVEIITGTMISSGRLKGAIDQDYQVLEFIDDKIDEQYGIGVQEVEEDDLPIDERITTLKLQSELGLKAHEFDVSIKTICSKLDNIVDLIDAQVPTEWISLNR